MLMNGLLLGSTAYAFNFGNIMNSSRWMGADDYDDDYYYGGQDYGYGGYPGYGVYGGYPGSATPGLGYTGLNVPNLGFGENMGYPGYGYQVSSYSAQHTGGCSSAAEIDRLKERISKLEKTGKQAPSIFNGTSDYSAPPPSYEGQSGYQVFSASYITQQDSGASPLYGNQPQARTFQPDYGKPPQYRFE
jgi:hypothetical protein